MRHERVVMRECEREREREVIREVVPVKVYFTYTARRGGEISNNAIPWVVPRLVHSKDGQTFDRR